MPASDRIPLNSRWSLRFQTTLLAVLLTIAGVATAAWLTHRRSKATLLEHEVVDLRDETNLRVADLRSEFTELGRALRTLSAWFANRVAMTHPEDNQIDLNAIVQDAEFARDWQQQLNKLFPARAPGSPIGDRFDGSAIEGIFIYDRLQEQNVLVRATQPGREELPLVSPSPLAEQLVNHTLATSPREAHPIAESTEFVLEQYEGRTICRMYLARRLYLRKQDQPLDLMNARGVILAQVNITHYLNELSRRAPRHNYFLIDPLGTYLFHPLHQRVGTNVNDPAVPDPMGQFQRVSWHRDRVVTDEQNLSISRGDIVPVNAGQGQVTPIPGLTYFHTKKKLPAFPPNDENAARLRATFNAEMREFARSESQDGQSIFRFGELTELSTQLEMSHRTEAGLLAAMQRADVLLGEWPQRDLRLSERVLSYPPFGAPGADWHPVLHCKDFVACLALLNTDLGEPPTDIEALSKGHTRFVSAASVQEIEQDALIATVPALIFTMILVCIGAGVLSYFAVGLVTRPLARIGDAAHTLSEGAKRIALQETDPSSSGVFFAVSLPSTGPKEVLTVATAFREMVGQLEHMTTQLRHRTAEVQAILETAVDGILIFSSEGDIKVANHAAEQLFGYESHELTKIRIQTLVPALSLVPTYPTSTGKDTEIIVTPELIHLNNISRLEFQATRRDGSVVWAEASINRINLSERTLYTGIIRDISERKKAEDSIQRMNQELDQRVREKTASLEEANTRLSAALEEAEAANRSKLNLLHNVSHELRTPLAAITNTAEMFFHPKAAAIVANPLPRIKTIKVASELLRHLVENLLLAFEVQATKQTHMVNRSEFSLDPFLNETIDILKPIAGKYQNQFTVDIPADLGMIWTDRIKLRQVLLNLLGNACKYSSRKSVHFAVTRATRPLGDVIEFSIQDTGIGMTAETIRRLGEPFYRGDSETARKETGTGLGMMVTKTLIAQLGGSLDITSELGQGTNVTVSIPTAEPARTTDPQSLGVSTGQTLLVIDDDPLIRNHLALTLQQEGYKVLEAADGDEGLRLAREHRPAAITLDVMMPHKDGWITLSELKSDPELRTIPVIMISLIDNRSRGIELGAVDFLTKPVDRDYLMRLLSRHAGLGPILIVEDDEKYREEVASALDNEQWPILTAGDGATALDLVVSHRPALILLDLLLPAMDGFTFIEELKKRVQPPLPPVIVMTALTLTEEDRNRLNGSVSIILEKHAMTPTDLAKDIRQRISQVGITPQS